jgi:hypothetical protein
VAHVGVERFPAGHGQEHGAEHRKAVEAVHLKKRKAVPRIEGAEHQGRLKDPAHAQDRHRDEPEHHDRTKQPAHTVGAVLLNGEDADENHDGDRHDIRMHQRRRHRQPFHRAEDRNRGRDHAVTIQERRPKNAQRDQDRARLAAVDPVPMVRGWDEGG